MTERLPKGLVETEAQEDFRLKAEDGFSDRFGWSYRPPERLQANMTVTKEEVL